MLPPFGRIFGTNDKNNQSLDDKLINKDIDLDTSLDVEYHPDEVVQIPLSDITPNRYQPRTIFNEEKIKELAQTIHTHGMIQPIVVRKIEDGNGKYEIIAGERRYRAVTELKWDTVPAIIRKMNDKETASVALIENLQREELTVIEEAKAYQRLIDIHELTQEALAQRLGKNQSTIANKLRLLKLPEKVHQSIIDKQISERHARALIRLNDEELIIRVLNEIVQKNLNVKQTEERINQLIEPTKTKQKKPQFKGVSRDIRIAMNTIKQSLSMVTDTGVDLETNEEDHENYYQITIKIAKNKK